MKNGEPRRYLEFPNHLVVTVSVFDCFDEEFGVGVVLHGRHACALLSLTLTHNSLTHTHNLLTYNFLKQNLVTQNLLTHNLVTQN